MDLIVVYTAVTFVLNSFPYTRPWGESMRGFLLATVEHLGLGVAEPAGAVYGAGHLLDRAIRGPAGRAVVRRGRAGTHGARWIYPETAQPTRRL